VIDPHFVEDWDDPSQGADWDSGLQWDVNVGPSSGTVAAYLALITSEYNQQPNFMAMLAKVFEPVADNIAVMQSMPGLFSLDTAVGEQLDFVGQWIGVSRNIAVPLAGVYFTLDSTTLGFDAGTWFSQFDPVAGVVSLSDDDYRTLLRARIARNQWDGSIPGAYAVWDTLFAGTGLGILIQDLENMHMIMALTGDTTNAVTLALFKGGYLSMDPEGVMVDAYMTPSVPSTPYFGFDVENSAISGFDAGAWGLTS
jgi:Protein of unknown function (DUF2612)